MVLLKLEVMAAIFPDKGWQCKYEIILLIQVQCLNFWNKFQPCINVLSTLANDTSTEIKVL